jgi:NAD(P)-dependent dehydrogenase (short-subunit alcohol dehydrogenase family)
MKKIIVTGHSSGLGKAIFDYFKTDPDNNVIGFSRANGFNITSAEKRTEIVNASADADIFVNNAYNFFDDSQTFMLQELYASWAGQNKTIINISTIATITANPTHYAVTKRRLDHFCIQNTFNLPQIINLKPGWIMVDRVKQEIGDKNHMTTDQVIEVMEYCLKSPIKFTSLTFNIPE